MEVLGKGEQGSMYVQMEHVYKTFDGFHASSDVSFGVA